MNVRYELMYLFGFKPWDSGVTPPELVAAVEGPEALAPGRALDLGCGTGTNAVYLARRGWEVTAIEQVGRALKAGRGKAAAAGVSPWFVRGDVTKLPELGIGGGYRLVFDLGCLHSVARERRDAYAAGVTAAAAPGATFLLFGFAPGTRLAAGIDADELRTRLPGWELRDATRGTDRIESWWYRLERRAS
ncbi:MAG TPA: methyltransferase domain-containing protein [Candidatus Dormibacteraeota bacterium]|nr:methyltransferase domain-containing protein [Candidatus Dormibacteraeota bacterium]